MVVPSLAVSSDNHLSQRAWAKYPGLFGDSYYSFRQIVDYCTAHDLDLLLAGDVLDKMRPDPTTAQQMRMQLDRMERHNLGVRYIQGQHELDRNSPWMNTLSWWPEHVHKKQFEIIPGVMAYGLDWLALDMIQDELAEIPSDTTVLVAHQVWRDFMGRVENTECSFSDVPHARMLITGDFHKHMIADAHNKNGDCMVVLSPGSICMMSINEPPEKYFFILNEDLTTQSIKLKTRQCFRFNITTKDGLDQFISLYVSQVSVPQADVPEHIAKNIVNIVYDDSVPEIYNRITSALSNKVHLFLSPIRPESDVVMIETEQRRMLAEGGLESCLKLIVSEDSHIYKNAQLLLRSTDPQQQIETMKKMFLNANGLKDD